MRIAQISDLHFTHLTWNPFRLFSKRILGHLNWLFLRKKQFVEEQVFVLPELFQSLQVDYVLIGGDISTTSLREEFEKGLALTQKIQQPWFAVPGNHDCYTKRSCRQKHFYRYFQKGPLQEERIAVQPLKEGWTLILLDTALATPPYLSSGLFSEELEARLRKTLRELPREESVILLNHFPFFQNDIDRHNLKRGEALQKVLEESPQIRLYLHGHSHRQTVADLQTSGLPIVLDGGSCAQGKKGSWNLIDMEKEKCVVSTYRWNGDWTKTSSEKLAWTRK